MSRWRFRSADMMVVTKLSIGRALPRGALASRASSRCQRHANSVRIASSLRADMIFGKDRIPSGFFPNEYRVVLHRLSGQSPISAHARSAHNIKPDGAFPPTPSPRHLGWDGPDPPHWGHPHFVSCLMTQCPFMALSGPESRHVLFLPRADDRVRR